MKNKIKEALRQEYKSRLELDDERLDGVAAFAATFVTDEGKIEEFVKNEATLAMLKTYQSVADKARAAAKAKNEPNPKDPDPDNKPEPKPEPPKPETPDFKAMLAEALADVVNPLKEELATFKAEQSAKIALTNAEAAFKSNDYVKKYSAEATRAWKIANEIYELGGKKMTAEELNDKAMDYFKDFVSDKGVDTTKPFESDGGAGKKDSIETDKIIGALKSRGNWPDENNK